MTERYRQLLPADPGAPGVRAGWNEAEPPVLPALTAGERLRLALRGGLGGGGAGGAVRGFPGAAGRRPRLAARIAGRPVTRLGPRVVRAWAAQALPTLGLRFVQHGEPMRRGGAFVANHSSWIDIVVLQRAAAPFLVSKAEVRELAGDRA